MNLDDKSLWTIIILLHLFILEADLWISFNMQVLLFSIFVVPQETNSVKGQVKLKTEQFQYDPDYKNQSSKRFKELSRTFKDNVSSFLFCEV